MQQAGEGVADLGVTVLGGVPVQSPQTRVMDSGYLPAITVQSPTIGEHVSNAVTVAGTANVFEATVSIDILKDGQLVNRWTSTGFLAASATTNETAYITYKVVRSMGMVVFDNQARV